MQRGVGLTPRLFEWLVRDPGSTAIEAKPAAYVQAIGRHVQSKMASHWVPVVCEDAQGNLRTLHVDPIAVRRFRRTIAEELLHVREKRRRMLSRVHKIRQGFPEPSSREVASWLRRDIESAEARLEEPLVPRLPEGATALHILFEVTGQMIQLELVVEHLVRELPAALQATSIRHLSLMAASGSDSTDNHHLVELPGDEEGNAEALAAAAEWLLRFAAGRNSPRSGLVAVGSSSSQQPSGGDAELRLAGALRRAFTSDVLSGRAGAILVLACSKPADLEQSLQLLRRSEEPLLAVGVYGEAAEDAEPALQQLVDGAAPGSALNLWFGSTYWQLFLADRRQRLQTTEQQHDTEEADLDFKGDEVISANILEMRLIERVLRECHDEAQQCEKELLCAGRVLNRTLNVHPEGLKCVMQGERWPSRSDPITTH